MKSICLVVAVSALMAGCSTTLSAEEKAMADAYADGYAPTGTMIKRKDLNSGSKMVVANQQQMENDRDTGGRDIDPRRK